jgi:hypothetical protein
MADMTDKQIAEEWLKYSISDWQKAQRRLRIHQTGTLFNSLGGKVSAGSTFRVIVDVYYAWYGQMVDMGVGNGVKSGEQKDTATMRRILGKKAGADRKPKRWYSKGKNSMGFQTLRLATLLGANKAHESVHKISGAIEHKHTIRIV